MASHSSEDVDGGINVASNSRRKGSPGTPRHGGFKVGSTAWHSKWEAMESDMFETNHSAEADAPRLDLNAHDSPPKPCESKWETMELDMFESNRSAESDAPRLEMSTRDSPPKPCESKWENMEVDLRQAADDEFAAPRFALPEDPPCCVSPPGRNVIPTGRQKKKKAKHRQHAETDTPADARGNDESGRCLGDIFDSRDLAELRGKAPRLHVDESELKERSERPVAVRDELQPRSSPPSSKSAFSFPPRLAKSPRTPTKHRAQPSTPRRPLAETYGRKAPFTPKVAATSISVGRWVKLQGLVGRENLNGAKGQVEGWLADRGRWRVRCIGQLDAIFARTDNLILLDDSNVETSDSDSQDKGDSSRQSHLQDMALEPMSPCVSPRTARAARDAPPAFPDLFIDQCSSKCSSNSLTALLPKDDSEIALTDRLNVINDIERGCQGEHIEENLTAEPDVAAILAYSEVLNLNSLAKTHEDVKLVLDAGLVGNESTKAVDILPGAPLKAIRCFWRLWYALILLCVLEFLLLVASVGLDRFWSPCRKQLKSCHSIHINDCEGISCEEGAPIWAPAWPLATFIFTVVPIRILLSSGSSGGMPGRPRYMLFALLISVAVVGGGAASLSQMTGSGIHYAARCPMQRSVERCGDHICPAPCNQKSDFSPCVCGLLGEDEMARALFLSGAPACHPYEWYSWQMEVLEELLLRYETFACVFGPLGCAALVVGGMLLIVQLSCCPVLLFGSWGLHLSLLVLFAPASTTRDKSREVPRVIGKRNTEDQALEQNEEELEQLHSKSDADEKESRFWASSPRGTAIASCERGSQKEVRSSASSPRATDDDTLRDEQTVKSEAI